ncbi:hypothetical protein ACFWCB_29945 [Streptomyces sp. NPDC060048]|uniref:hypothetical protein n=1 Tax=unclassified Streptomyces TaxID=2593676 RepID=UPI0036D00530
MVVDEELGEVGGPGGEVVAGLGQPLGELFQVGQGGTGGVGDLLEGVEEGLGGFGLGDHGDGRCGQDRGVARAQGGQGFVEPVVENRVGGGPDVKGEELGGLVVGGVGDEVIGKFGVGLKVAAEEPLDQSVGLQGVPGAAAGRCGVEGCDPAAYGAEPVVGLLGKAGDAVQEFLGLGSVLGAEEEGRCQRVGEGVQGQGRVQSEGGGGGGPVATFVDQQSVLDPLRARGPGPGAGRDGDCGRVLARTVQQVGQCGHVQGQGGFQTWTVQRGTRAVRHGGSEPGGDDRPVVVLPAAHPRQVRCIAVYRLAVALGARGPGFGLQGRHGDRVGAVQ